MFMPSISLVSMMDFIFHRFDQDEPDLSLFVMDRFCASFPNFLVSSSASSAVSPFARLPPCSGELHRFRLLQQCLHPSVFSLSNCSTFAKSFRRLPISFLWRRLPCSKFLLTFIWSTFSLLVGRCWLAALPHHWCRTDIGCFIRQIEKMLPFSSRRSTRHAGKPSALSPGRISNRLSMAFDSPYRRCGSVHFLLYFHLIHTTLILPASVSLLLSSLSAAVAHASFHARLTFRHWWLSPWLSWSFAFAKFPVAEATRRHPPAYRRSSVASFPAGISLVVSALDSSRCAPHDRFSRCCGTLRASLSVSQTRLTAGFVPDIRQYDGHLPSMSHRSVHVRLRPLNADLHRPIIHRGFDFRPLLAASALFIPVPFQRTIILLFSMRTSCIFRCLILRRPNLIFCGTSGYWRRLWLICVPRAPRFAVATVLQVAMKLRCRRFSSAGRSTLGIFFGR